MMAEDIMFHKLADGTVHVVGDHWPHEVEWSGEVLEVADPHYLQRDGQYITITVANGTARYVITDRRPGTGIVEPVRDIFVTQLVSGVLNER